MQSAYRRDFSTETAILLLHNLVLSAFHERHSVLKCYLIYMYVSAAFDTVDHGIMLSSAVFEDRFLFRHGWSNFIPTATIVNKTIGNKCSDVLTKIQTLSYTMDHWDWPGNQ